MEEDLAKFYNALSDLVRSFEQKDLPVKMVSDVDSGIVRIYSERSDALARARAGLEEVVELAYDTAEHHPYWNLLYDGSQILKVVLEKWKNDLTDEDLLEIKWYANKIKDSLENAANKHHRQ